MNRTLAAEDARLIAAALALELEGRWHEALSAWQALVEDAAPQVAPRQQLGLARAAVRTGQHRLAEQALQAVLEQRPGHLNASLGLASLLEQQGLLREAFELLTGVRQGPEASRLLALRRIRLLGRLGRWAEMKAEFIQYLRQPTSHDDVERCLRFTWLFLGALPRDEFVGAILTVADQPEHRDDPRWADLRLRLLLIGRRYDEARRLWQAAPAGDPSKPLARVMNRISDPRYLDPDQPKVFGIGLSKTATTSLHAALDLLGYHSAHWSNPVTGEVLSEHDDFIFDALSDTSISHRFEALYERFPRSLFILTTRSIDSWVGSLTKHQRRFFGAENFHDLPQVAARLPNLNAEILNNLFARYAAPAEAYQAHLQRVSEFFTAERANRLLVIDICSGEGWSRLCAFLGKEIPEVPFPHQNTGRAFQ